MAREADTFTPGEVARALGLTEFTVLSLLTSGQLEGHQDEQARRWIPASAIDEAIMRRSASTDVQPDPSVEETVSIPPVSPTGSADTPATDTPASEDTIEFEADAEASAEADAGSMQWTPPT